VPLAAGDAPPAARGVTELGEGNALFDLACQHDLEGVVAKYKSGVYTSGREETTWFKIRNRSYSQWAGREELFWRPAR
jgi:ATP-dependent DNA ligase